MSRSYAKKYRICNTDKIAKRLANKKVRKIDDLPNGKSYKKVFNTWNINDSGKARLIPKINKDSDDFTKEWTSKSRRK